MSATKIAASFLPSLTALVAGRSPVAGASAWLHFHAALIETRRTGNADPAFGDQPSRAAWSIPCIGEDCSRSAREGLSSSAKRQRSGDGPVTGQRSSSLLGGRTSDNR